MTERPPGTTRLVRHRAVVIAGAIAAGAVAAVSIGVGSGRSSATAGGPSVAWAAVVRADLVATVPVQGALAYQPEVTLTGELSGTAYTQLPVLGQVISRGQRLATVDDRPIYMFYGAVPAWRDLAYGIEDGPDVAQLHANLIALGYAPRGEFAQDADSYTWATVSAVERWQAAVGLAVTGTVPLGTIIYAPGAIRVTSLAARLGGQAQPGAPLIGASSPTPVVDVPLPVGQESLLHVRDQVTVTMPDGHTTAAGVVAAISPVASAPTGNGGQPTVAVTIRLAHRPRAAGALDRAPVTVEIVTGTAHDALAVPVNSLVSLAGGGYAVDVRGPHGAGLVKVRPGLFASGLVQVQGDLSPSDRVEVPPS
jgi:peptidoglycan hydrolase-like protein with peptidoglycan-binding domain